MRVISFYQQKRQDGGVRYGMEVDGNTVLGRYQAGPGDPDPALLWYVDVICKGRQIPESTPDAQAWLIENEANITSPIRLLAQDVIAGVDPDIWPARCAERKNGVTITASCSSIRRMESGELSRVLNAMARQWTTLIRRLRQLEPVEA